MNHLKSVLWSLHLERFYCIYICIYLCIYVYIYSLFCIHIVNYRAGRSPWSQAANLNACGFYQVDRFSMDDCNGFQHWLPIWVVNEHFAVVSCVGKPPPFHHEHQSLLQSNSTCTAHHISLCPSHRHDSLMVSPYWIPILLANSHGFLKWLFLCACLMGS